MINVAFLPANIDACAMYRMYIPHLNTPGSRFLFCLGPLDTRNLEGVNVCVVQRQVTVENLKAMRRMKEIGMKVIYDLDDNIWALPASNPAKQVFDSMKDGFEQCAREADILTVSTRGLASAMTTGFKQIGKQVMVVPNAIDLNLFVKKDLIRDDGLVTVGWGGSNTHSDDVKEAFDVIPIVLDKYKHVRMEIAGAPAEERIIKMSKVIDKDGRHVQRKEEILAPTRIGLHPQTRFRHWIPVAEYPNRLSSWGWDIAIAPLEDNRFNRSKSNIKMLEAAALKIPCLVSDVQPYSEFCALGGDDLKWLLCRTKNDWVVKLTALIHEPEHRKAIGEKMFDVANRFYNAHTVGNNWQYTFKQALGLN